MRFGSTAKVLLKCKLKYYRISECVREPCHKGSGIKVTMDTYAFAFGSELMHGLAAG